MQISIVPKARRQNLPSGSIKKRKKEKKKKKEEEEENALQVFRIILGAFERCWFAAPEVTANLDEMCWWCALAGGRCGRRVRFARLFWNLNTLRERLASQVKQKNRLLLSRGLIALCFFFFFLFYFFISHLWQYWASLARHSN